MYLCFNIFYPPSWLPHVPNIRFKLWPKKVITKKITKFSTKNSNKILFYWNAKGKHTTRKAFYTYKCSILFFLIWCVAWIEKCQYNKIKITKNLSKLSENNLDYVLATDTTEICSILLSFNLFQSNDYLNASLAKIK